jgi:hypothetical protein
MRSCPSKNLRRHTLNYVVMPLRLYISEIELFTATKSAGVKNGAVPGLFNSALRLSTCPDRSHFNTSEAHTRYL